MAALVALLDFAGYVALMLWGIHMVHTGVQRAFGATLGATLSRILGTRLRAFLVGLGLTAALQSSTATGLMITGLVAAEIVALVPALAAMLGANVGTTLIVQVLALDITALSPVLILAGVWLFRKFSPGRPRDLGRVLIGLGLLLMALHQLISFFAPIQNAPILNVLIEALATQPIALVLLTAALTWVAHSSVAIIVLIMSLCNHGIVTPSIAFAMVLGANLGTAINPLTEGAIGGDPASRRLPLGNLITRIAGVLVGLTLLPWLPEWMNSLADNPLHATANFHTLFNLTVALFFLPFLNPLSRLLTSWLPKRPNPHDPAQSQYLDETVCTIPAIALGNAAREVLRMADILQTLLLYARAGVKRDNRHRLIQARQWETALDKLENSIVSYLAKLDQETMTSDDRQRLNDILAFSNNIRHAGAIAYHGLLGHITKLHKQALSLETEQRTKLDETLAHLINNQRQCAALFMNEDLKQARILASQKEYFRLLETEATDLHLQKIKSGQLEVVEGSILYLDMLRDVKGINSHLVGAVAYPLLSRQGELLTNRIRQAMD